MARFYTINSISIISLVLVIHIGSGYTRSVVRQSNSDEFHRHHTLVKRHIPLDCNSSTNKTSENRGVDEDEEARKERKENISKLASTLVLVVFIPGLCCIFFLCFKCPFFHAWTNIQEKLLQKKAEKEEALMASVSNTPNLHHTVIPQRPTPKQSQTICCNAVCICLRIQKETSPSPYNGKPVVKSTVITKSPEFIELVDLASVVAGKSSRQHRQGKPVMTTVSKVTFDNDAFDDD